jgi:hypothetical protein
MKYSLSKPHIKFPKVPFISTTWLYVGIAVGLVLAVIAFGAVRSVQADKAARQEQVQRAEQAKAAATAQTKLVESLQAQVKTEQAKNEAICSWIRGVAPKYKIAVPPLCVVPKI